MAIYEQIASNKHKSLLLILLFFVVLGLLGYAFGVYTGDTFGALTLAGIIAIIMALVSYYKGDKVALSIAGAYPITAEQNQYLWRIVENLCIAQGMPMPRVYLIPDQAMNAFACGRDPEHASIAFTEGIVAKLENEELEGVAAHELSHIKNLDIRLQTLVIVLIGMIAILSDMFLRSGRFFRSGRNEREGGAGVIVLVGFALALLAPVIANLIKLAISRRREFLADASGALATRYPEGLARALEKINADGTPLHRASSATAHLFIASPFGRGGGTMSKLFSTHPPIAERVAALRKMA